jgi:hypothetical protein
MNIINIVDAPCGYGKTSWAIQAMNETSLQSHKFIYVTPFLNEVARVKESVKSRTFFSPEANDKVDTKLTHLHKLLKEGKDICTTHSLFQMSNSETRKLLQAHNYTLILDEVLNVINQVDLRKHSLALLKDAGAIFIEEDKNGIKYVRWNEDKRDYDTEYNSERNMALTGNLMYLNERILMWNFPSNIFTAFEHVYLLTYLFKGQLQRYYYDLHGIKYRYLSVEQGEDGYNLVPYDLRILHDKENLRKLLNIYEGNLNEIGKPRTALSSTWLKNKENTDLLKKHTYNYLTNKVKANNSNTLWTTYKDSMKKVQPRNFKESFLSVTSRATNEHKEKYNLAYLVNRFMFPVEKQFFQKYGVAVDQETWALSELIQWVWRSRIREGKPINIYIPSSRMRNLLYQYLNSDVFELPPQGAITNQYSSDWNFS